MAENTTQEQVLEQMKSLAKDAERDAEKSYLNRKKAEEAAARCKRERSPGGERSFVQSLLGVASLVILVSVFIQGSRRQYRAVASE